MFKITNASKLVLNFHVFEPIIFFLINLLVFLSSQTESTELPTWVKYKILLKCLKSIVSMSVILVVLSTSMVILRSSVVQLSANINIT